MRETTERGPSTLRRGLRVLDVLRRAGPDGLHVVQVAEQAGIQRSTVYRFLDVLVDTGYAVRDEHDRRWYRIAAVDHRGHDPHAAAVRKWAGLLRRVSDDTGDSAFLVCRAGNDSLCLHREVGNYPVQVLAVTIGHRQPLGVGAAGLAFLAALPPEETADVISQNAEALRAYGNMTPKRMHALVDAARDRGWAVVGNSAVAGVVGVGAALRDGDGRPVLAVSVSSILARMPAARQRKIAEALTRGLGSPVGFAPIPTQAVDA